MSYGVNDCESAMLTLTLPKLRSLLEFSKRKGPDKRVNAHHLHPSGRTFAIMKHWVR